MNVSPVHVGRSRPVLGLVVGEGRDLLPGVPDDTGAGGGYYLHEQTAPASVWQIAHQLGRRPAAVSLFSLDFSVQYAEFSVQHLDVDHLRTCMDVPATGVALIQ